MTKTAVLWGVWLLATLVGGAAVAGWVLVGGDRTSLLIGQTTGVHHQFEVSCDTCHAAPAFSTAKKTLKKLNKTCLDCHKEELQLSQDSHPRKKFRDPRMADFWEKIDARNCTSCHLEHKPEITRAGAVTLAMDYCVACHSEGKQDVRVNRPSHANLEFTTCADAGCHNFHDNRALYEDFLVKHADQPWLKAEPAIALTVAARAPLEGEALETAMAKWLKKGDAIAPASALEGVVGAAALEEWVASGHAEAGVNCAGCHAPKLKETASVDEIEAAWIAQPERAVCAKCHKDQNKTFVRGRHGARAHPDIAKPRKLKKQFKALGLKGFEENLPAAMVAWLEDPAPPAQMSVAEARIPMKLEAADRVLDCVSCHGPHEYDLAFASAEGCVSCHDDEHSLAYFESPHSRLWKAETSGEAAIGTGVSCASCHMPKQENAAGGIFTNHNQNDVLRPNEKMIRAVCMDCHGLAFSIDALADPDLVARNFQGRPAKHIESIDWAVRRVRDGGEGANQTPPPSR